MKLLDLDAESNDLLDLVLIEKTPIDNSISNNKESSSELGEETLQDKYLSKFQHKERSREFFKRNYYMSYLNSAERPAADFKLNKGKRVKNMFSSGLQGVWGVPGK